MGCTSSAPNMADIHLNTTNNGEDNKSLETPQKEKVDEMINDVTINDQAKIVLPMCDNLDENIQLDSNDSKINNSEASIQQVEIDDHINGSVEHETTLADAEESTVYEFPKLKEVVDQVILENIFQSIENVSTFPDKENTPEETVVEIDEDKKVSEDIVDYEDTKENNGQEEKSDESVSPSQSECSRATRWEALADIAAELPPSLAVDPLTGQIYSLSK